MAFNLGNLQRRRRPMDQTQSLGPTFGSPGFNPAAEALNPTPVTLPDAPERPILASPAAPIPAGRGLPSPPLPAPKTRMQQMAEAKEGYMLKTPGRGRSAASGALSGLSEGARAGGSLASGLGGALAGALVGAVSPKTVRERQFEQVEKPQLLEGFAMEDQEAARRAQAEKALREDEYNQARIGDINSGIRSRSEADRLNREKFDEERNRLIMVGPEQSALDPRTRQPVFTGPPRTNPTVERDSAAAALTDQEGTVEQITNDSFQGRVEGLKQRLTSNERRIIEKGPTQDDSPQMVEAAQRKWDKIQSDERESIRRDTSEKRKAGITKRRFDGSSTPTKSSTGQSGPRAKLSDLKKYLQ